MRVDFGLNGIRLCVEYPEALAGLMPYFAGSKPGTDCSACIESLICLVDRISPVAHSVFLSRTIQVSPRGLTYHSGTGVAVHFIEVSPTRIRSVVDVQIPRRRWSLVRKIVTRSQTQHHNLFMQAIRYALVFPYLMLLMWNYGAIVSHGTVFTVNDKCFAVLGFDGVGKSTLAATILDAMGQVLSDNFAVFLNDRAFAVVEPVRLTSGTGPICYGKAFTKISTDIDHSTLSGLVYTYLGDSYRFGRSSLSVESITRQLQSYLPEFYDFGRYLTCAQIVNGQVIHLGQVQIAPRYQLYECQRSTLNDNRRLLDDLMSVQLF